MNAEVRLKQPVQRVTQVEPEMTRREDLQPQRAHDSQPA